MDKMKYPRGLIRYATENGLAQHLDSAAMWRRVFRPRVLIYTGVLVLIVGAMMASLALRSPFRVDVVRDRATLARLVDDGQIENVYRLQVMNATEAPQRYRVAVSGLAGIAVAGNDRFEVGPAEARWVTVALRIPPESAGQAGAGVHPIRFEVERIGATAQASVTTSEKSTFVVPR
jgi:polyferredoxin